MKVTEKKEENPLIYDTDKFGMPYNVLVHHMYGDFYDELLFDKQELPISLLEVGIFSGGAIRLFHDYLINATIVGVDITDEKINQPINNYDRLSVFITDAYNIDNWTQLPKKMYDIIIDDGPHTLSSQIFALTHFPDFLTPGGVLIIEDVPVMTVDRIINGSHRDRSKITTYDWSGKTNRHDDVIITYTNE